MPNVKLRGLRLPERNLVTIAYTAPAYLGFSSTFWKDVSIYWHMDTIEKHTAESMRLPWIDSITGCLRPPTCILAYSR